MKKSLLIDIKSDITNIFNPNRFLLKLIILVLTFWSLFLIWNYRNIFSGDAEIHIIFARNLLCGHALQFNPGYYSG